MRCGNCGVRIQASNYDPRWSNEWVHVTDNGDRIGTYCRLQQATPTTEGAGA